MPITALPAPPSRLDPVNFSARADSFLAALPQFAAEMNAGTPGDSAFGLAQSLAAKTSGAGGDIIGHSFALNYAVGTIGAALNDICLNVSQFPWLAALDGVTDDTAAIQACITFAPNGSTILIPGVAKCSSQILVTGKTGLTLMGSRTSKLLFTDGAYIGLLFDGNSQHCKIENLRFFGTNTLTPAITLIKATGSSAYLTIDDCGFAYASIAVLCAATYVVKLRGNQYSNCDTYVKAIATEGGTADLLLLGETFGTSLIGTNALVDLQFIFARLTGCYFEVESRIKPSITVKDIPDDPGLHYTVTGCQFFASGPVVVNDEANLTFCGNASERSHGSASLYFIRIGAEATATITGNMMSMNAVVPGLAGISCSGKATVTGNTIRNFPTGAAFAAGICDANTFIDCAVGISTGVGSVAVVGNTNSFVNCATWLANASTTAAAPRAITVALTGCATAPTGSARYEVDNGVVTLTLPALSATSNSTACTITGLSAAITPIGISVFGSVVLILDNGTQSVEQIAILSTGIIELRKNGSATGFTGSGTKGVRECVITYRLRNV